MVKLAVALKLLAGTSFGTLMAATALDENKFTAKPASNVPYLIAIVVVLLIGVIAVLAITMLRPNTDNAALLTMVIGLLIPTLGTLLTFIKTQETHLSVNSQMEEMKGFMKRVYFAEGVAQGRVPVVTVVPPPAAPGVIGAAIDNGATVTIKKEGELPR